MKGIFKLFKNFQVVSKFSLNGPFILMFTREEEWKKEWTPSSFALDVEC